MKQNKKKKYSLFYIKILFFSLCTVFFLNAFFHELYITYSIRKQLKIEESLNKEYSEELEKYETMKSQLDNFEYLEIYTKGQLLITEEDEQVFKLSNK